MNRDGKSCSVENLHKSAYSVTLQTRWTCLKVSSVCGLRLLYRAEWTV